MAEIGQVSEKELEEYNHMSDQQLQDQIAIVKEKLAEMPLLRNDPKFSKHEVEGPIGTKYYMVDLLNELAINQLTALENEQKKRLK